MCKHCVDLKKKQNKTKNKTIHDSPITMDWDTFTLLKMSGSFDVDWSQFDKYSVKEKNEEVSNSYTTTSSSHMESKLKRKTTSQGKFKVTLHKLRSFLSLKYGFRLNRNVHLNPQRRNIINAHQPKVLKIRGKKTEVLKTQ